MITKTIKKIRNSYISYRIRKGYKNLYNKIYKSNPKLKTKRVHENEWIKRWKILDCNVSKDSYRIFSHYIGESLDIVPLETCSRFIDPILSPREFYSYYNDKNIFNKLFPYEYMPTTIIRCMNGCYYDNQYNNISKGKETTILNELLKAYNKIIVKPTINGESGKNVQIFKKHGNCWINRNNEKLTIKYLNNFYCGNFIIQEFLYQHPILEQLNPSSVNTIRIMTYRSVVDNEIIIPNSILRIGKDGSDVDNAHSGGMFCGISSNGVLGKYVCDYLGNKKSKFNMIDFSQTNIILPNFPIIKEFAKDIANRVLHHRLLALDIMIDSNGNPKLIEINVGGFSAWLFQFTTGTTFGEYTDEIINYCISQKDNLLY